MDIGVFKSYKKAFNPYANKSTLTLHIMKCIYIYIYIYIYD